jgi:hypothetical protein
MFYGDCLVAEGDRSDVGHPSPSEPNHIATWAGSVFLLRLPFINTPKVFVSDSVAFLFRLDNVRLFCRIKVKRCPAGPYRFSKLIPPASQFFLTG